MPIDGRWILFAGRLQEQKAPLRLIDTFNEYRNKNNDAVLIIIGGGNLLDKTEKYVQQLNLQEDIFFLGRMKQETLSLFYKAADVLLLTSNYEGMPRSVLEALGCGLPIVSTDVGEVKRVVKNSYSGEVVKSFEPKNIADGLKKVLHNPLTYKMEQCIQCIDDFKPEKVLRPVYELIERMNMEEKGSVNV